MLLKSSSLHACVKYFTQSISLAPSSVFKQYPSPSRPACCGFPCGLHHCISNFRWGVSPVAFAHTHVLFLLPEAAFLYLQHSPSEILFLVLPASSRVLYILCVPSQALLAHMQPLPCMSGKPQDILIQGLTGIWGNHSVSSIHRLAAEYLAP